jgi:hypothetical protein
MNPILRVFLHVNSHRNEEISLHASCTHFCIKLDQNGKASLARKNNLDLRGMNIC